MEQKRKTITAQTKPDKESFEGKEMLTTRQAMNFLDISRTGLRTLVEKKVIIQYSIPGLEKLFYKKSELSLVFKPIAG